MLRASLFSQNKMNVQPTRLKQLVLAGLRSVKGRGCGTWAVGIVVLATIAWPLAAQVTTSVIEGTVSDTQGLRIGDAEVSLKNLATGALLRTRTNASGSYRVSTVAAGDYSLTVTHEGFRSKIFEPLTVAVNQSLKIAVVLEVGAANQLVSVTAEVPLIDTTSSSSGGTITPDQIEQTPLNGRNYSDLLQLIPGVAINRQSDPAHDSAAPILGERGGNALFLIDGLPNRNEVNGGAGAQFNQDSILEFQVITGGYKAEFGHGSGGVINVISRGGTNRWHGGASFFHRNYKLDSSDTSGLTDLPQKVPFLLRYDPTVYLGGPVAKDKAFFFGSFERIRETRSLNFVPPPSTPSALQAYEAQFDLHNQTYETRGRVRLDQQLGRHRLNEQLNMTNTHISDFLPLILATNLPDTRNNISNTTTMLGFSDLVLLGDLASPYILNGYFQHRREPFLLTASHQQGGQATTLFNLFSSLDTGGLFGDLGQVQFGPGHTPVLLKPSYENWGLSLAHLVKNHSWKLGWDAMRLRINGNEANNNFSQLFATVDDFERFGATQSGVYFLTTQNGANPENNKIGIRNLYDGLFVQDDWKVRPSLTLNLGVRWDYDSSFPNAANVSPRLGVAWAITPKTVINASYGQFYDHFRLGLARDIPAFGGASITGDALLSFPRLFYGDPSFVSIAVGGPCLSSNMTDAQIVGQNCPFAPTLPYFGIDHLNGVVAPGHAPIPADAAVNLENVNSLTGFTPQQFADAASAAIGKESGYFSYDINGNLVTDLIRGTTLKFPITVDSRFRTPYSRNFHVGVQRELTSTVAISADYYHRNIRNILGVRATNLAFGARLNNMTFTTSDGQPITETYGPWYSGQYDGLTIDFKKRLSHHFNLELSYTYAHETDNALNGNFVSDIQSGNGVQFASLGGPTDSFVGLVPVVTDPVTGQSNANSSFVVAPESGNAAGNPVPKAGQFYNGANLDKGPSDLAVPHIFFAYGVWQLPWKMDLSGVFRTQSGFHYSRNTSSVLLDVDGDNITNGLDFAAGRNHFVAPAYINLDMRIAKRFSIRDRVRVLVLLEYFNLFNRANPAAVETLEGQPVPFGGNLQVLPGREGQVGIRFDF